MCLCLSSEDPLLSIVSCHLHTTLLWQRSSPTSSQSLGLSWDWMCLHRARLSLNGHQSNRFWRYLCLISFDKIDGEWARCLLNILFQVLISSHWWLVLLLSFWLRDRSQKREVPSWQRTLASYTQRVRDQITTTSSHLKSSTWWGPYTQHEN